MAMMLIDHGAVVDKDNNRRWTPLFAAAWVGCDSSAAPLSSIFFFFFFFFLISMFTEFYRGFVNWLLRLM